MSDYTIDRIIISLTSDCISGWIGDQTYTKYDTDTFYACGWNDTVNSFVKLVDVDWASDDTAVGTVNPLVGSSSALFTAEGEGTCRVSATNATYGLNWTGIITVNPLEIDRIIISRTPDCVSGWAGDQTYIVYETDTFYACGWNDTYNEFVQSVSATWISDDSSCHLYGA